jgi:polysaccharide biosynthesis protein PslG
MPLPFTPSPPFNLAVHTLIMDDRSLGLARAAGVGWVVQLFEWRAIEPEAGKFNWESADAAMRAAAYYRLHVAARLDKPPEWALAPNAGKLLRSVDDYARFVTAFVRRYPGQLAAVVVWNEPNLASEWNQRSPDPVEYVTLLQSAYRAVKAADPAIVVVSAGLAPTNERGARALDDREYLRQMYEHGAQGYFDALGAHPYGFGYAPDDPRGAHAGLNFMRMLDLRDIMSVHGDVGKPVWATEVGWTIAAVEQSGGQKVSPKEQGDYLGQAVAIARRDWPWLQFLAVWNIIADVPEHDQFVGYSIVDDDGSPRPAFRALQDAARVWPATPAQSEADDTAVILAQDVVIHLGDSDLPEPWASLYLGINPSPSWKGEFYMTQPQGPWDLRLEVLQVNQPGTRTVINAQSVSLPDLPPEEFERQWVSVTQRVPAGVLRQGLNTIELIAGKNVPAVQVSPDLVWDDFQFRRIRLGKAAAP